MSHSTLTNNNVTVCYGSKSAAIACVFPVPFPLHTRYPHAEEWTDLTQLKSACGVSLICVRLDGIDIFIGGRQIITLLTMMALNLVREL